MHPAPFWIGPGAYIVAVGVAADQGILWFGTQANQTSLAPEIVVASQVYKWEVILRQILDEIQSGEFAREWMAEYEAGSPNLNAARASIAEHPVEVTGKRLRDMMTFMVAKTPADDV